MLKDYLQYCHQDQSTTKTIASPKPVCGYQSLVTISLDRTILFANFHLCIIVIQPFCHLKVCLMPFDEVV